MKKSSHIGSLARWFLVTAIAAVFILLLAGPYSGSALQPTFETVNKVESSTSVAYIYSQDEQTGSDFSNLLVNDGYKVDLIPLPNQPGLRAYIPIVMASNGSAQVPVSAPAAANMVDLSKYDLIIIAHDTAESWAEQKLLADEIVASGKNVVAIGAGGAEFYLNFVQPDQGPASTQKANSVIASDVGASRPFYTETHAVDLDEKDTVQVLKQMGDALALSIEANRACRPFAGKRSLSSGFRSKAVHALGLC